MPTCSRWVILCCLRYYASRRPSNENCVEDEMMLNRKILEFSHLPIRGRNARDLQRYASAPLLRPSHACKKNESNHHVLRVAILLRLLHCQHLFGRITQRTPDHGG